MWQELWFLVVSTLRRTFRNRSNLVINFGLPIVGILLATVIYGSSGQPDLRIGVVNGDGSAKIAADTVQFMGKMNHMKLMDVTEGELKKQLAEGSLDGGLVLSEGYSDSVMAGQPDHIALRTVKGAAGTAYFQAMLNSYVDNVSAMARLSAGDSAKFERLYDHYSASNYKLTISTVNDSSSTKQMSSQSIGFLLMFMLTSSGSLSELILKNRENRTYFRILSSPISAKVYVLSNIIVNLIVMMAQIVVALFFMRAVFHLSAGVSFGSLGLLLAVYALVSVSLSLAVVSFAKSSGAASAMQNLIVTPSCLIAGCFFPISVMPETMQRIADFLPQRWVLQAIEKLQSGSGLRDIGLNFSILLVFAAVFFLIAVYKFGRSDDTRNFV
ncbi:ABC transporter permease [Paenibacillus rhizovicinus]|uniref:ABC transporter permease n=1 Tax=Paenibacillus rhizovicinus TaxID=2704463 RepID=A0A6C0NU22_9BACL|nr:ABC transporter permease [Paenibacillus rhizovicinus]QHW29621.1 ABC transporter permease [Paenibacillus rhizovicinus]